MKRYRVSIIPAQAGDTIETNDDDMVYVLPPLNETSQYDCKIIVLSKVP